MIKSLNDAYMLGLWCADGYHRTSSIGLSNINPVLISRFGEYLKRGFNSNRLKLRIYVPKGAAADKKLISKYPEAKFRKIKKARHAAYHIYVNSRPLLRRLKLMRNTLTSMEKDFIIPYLAGRFDGDGSINSNLKKDFRIVYGNRDEAETDKNLLQQIRPSYKVSIYQYKSARTYCLYVSQKNALSLVKDLLPYSLNLQKVITHTP